MNPPDLPEPETHASASRGTHPAWVMFALAVGSFAIGTTEFAAMSLLPFFANDLKISAPQAGHAISAYALGVVIGAPVIAVLAAKLNRRTLLMGLMALFALGNGLSATSANYTQLVAYRFLSGLPHGAYFGIAALVAASQVSMNRRAQSVAVVMSGLTVATIIGVPLANWLGQALGWRWGFGVVSVLALMTLVLVALFAPRQPAAKDASPLRELRALKRPQVLLTLLTGAVGFGGIFAIYTYVASTAIAVTHMKATMVPLLLAVFGLGMTAGNLFWAWWADRALNRAAICSFAWCALVMAAYPFATGSPWTLGLDLLLIGFGGGMGAILQTRLMDVAGDAQALAAAAHHSAFNSANALGPWLGGLAIGAGYGFASTGWIGVALSLGGLAIYLIAIALDARGRIAEPLPA